MSDEKLIELLNEDRSFELAAIIQYMGHHYEATGVDSVQVTPLLKDISIDEMRHAEMLAERINYLGGIPTRKPTEILHGGDLTKMIADDLVTEEGAIARYKAHIKVCEEIGDHTTRKMLEDILAQEEGHADSFQKILGR